MNKILRLALAAVLFVATSLGVSAQISNDRIELDGKVYAVISENLISNPGFDDNFKGWTGANDFATEITSHGFEIQTEEGHGNYLVGKINGGGDSADALGTAWQIEAGKTYYFAYDVKSLTDATDGYFLKSSLTNTKKEETSVLGTPTPVAGKWTTFEKVFTNTEEYRYCQVKFRWLNNQWGFDNFKLAEVKDITALVAAIDEYDRVIEKWRDANGKYFEGSEDEEYVANVDKNLIDASTLLNEAKELYLSEDAAAADVLAKVTAAEAKIDAAVNYAAVVVAEKEEVAEIDEIFGDGGVYYIQAADKSGFLAPGNSWGTQASIMDHSVVWKFVKKAAGVYTLESVVSNGGANYYFTGTFCDGNATNIYIRKGETEDTYYLATAFNNAFVKKGDNGAAKRPIVTNNGTKAEAQAWKIVKADVASVQKGDDITFLIGDADFGRNNRNQAAWKMEAGNQNLSGGKNENKVAESWQSTFTLSQVLKGLPEGYYTLTAQAATTLYSGETYAVIYGNGYSQPFNKMTDGEGGMDAMSTSFINGKYPVTVEIKLEKGEDLTIGAKQTVNTTWNVFDNFGLVYNGDDKTAFIAANNEPAYQELKDALKALQDQYASAKTTIAGCEKFADLYKKELDAMNDTINLAGDKGGIAKNIEDAYAATTCYEQKETILGTIQKFSDEISKYVKDVTDKQTADDLANDELSDEYKNLVQKWQDAYDEINNKYNEYLGEDNAFADYRTELTDIYNDEVLVIKKAIEDANKNSQSVEQQENINKSIENASKHIDSVLDAALSEYDAKVKKANQDEYNEFVAEADKLIDVYKDAIQKISDHYTTWHEEIAADAQLKLFPIFKAIQDVKTQAAEDYAAIEKSNAKKYAENDLPLDLFENDGYITNLNGIDMTQVQVVLAAAEADAIKENTPVLEKYENDYADLQAKYDKYVADLKADTNVNYDDFKADLEGDDKTKDAIKQLIDALGDDLAEFRVEGEVMDHYTTTTTEGEGDEAKEVTVDHKCVLEAKEDIDAQFKAIEDKFKAIDAKVLDVQNESLLKDILAKTADAQNALDAVLETIASYNADVQEKLAGKDKPIADAIKGVEEDAANDDAANKLVSTYAGYVSTIGEPTDTPDAVAVVDDPREDFETMPNSGSYVLSTSTNGWVAENVQVRDNTYTSNDFTYLPDGKKGVVINGKTSAVGKITSPIIKGGVSQVTVNYAYSYTESNGVSFKVALVNKKDKEVASYNVVDKDLALATAAKKTIKFEKGQDGVTLADDFNATDDVRIVITNNSPSNATGNKDRYTIWGITWPTEYDPTIYAQINGLKAQADKAQKESSDAYKKSLAEDLDELETAWNKAYAGVTKVDPEIDLEELHQYITDIDNSLEDDAVIYTDEAYNEVNDKIQEYTDLLTMNYDEWIDKYTLRGDEDLDGVVTVNDVVLAVQKALAEELELSKRESYASDANGDDEIDNADIVAIVNILLGEDEAVEVKALAPDMADGNDYLIVKDGKVSLENTTTFVSFSIDVAAVDGSDVTFELSERAASLTLVSKKLSNGNTRLVGYSMTNEPIAGDTGIILSANTDIVVDNAKFTDAKAKNHILTVLTEETTGINGLELVNGQVNGDIYTVGGAKIDALRKGVNIVKMADGSVKKVLVK